MPGAGSKASDPEYAAMTCDGDDDGVFGMEDEAPSGATGGAARKGSAPAMKRSAPMPADGDDGEHDGDATRCPVCDQKLENDIACRGSSSAQLHRDCLNAEVYMDRHLREKVGKEALARYKTEKASEYKYKVLELLMDQQAGRRRRGADERSKALQLVEELAFYSRCYRQHYIYMLGERAFKAWPFLWAVM